MPLWKLRDFSEFVVIDVVEDQADLIVGFEKAAYHSWVVKDLWSPLLNGLWEGAVDVKWLSHYDNFFTTEGFLHVWCPSIELVFGVWEQDGIIFGFGLLNDLEELWSDLWCGRNTFIGWASEDKEHILAFFNYFISLFIAITTTSINRLESSTKKVLIYLWRKNFSVIWENLLFWLKIL